MNTHNIDDLKTKGFVNVRYPQELKAAVRATVNSWQRFCSLPTDKKNQFSYSNGGAGVGYEMKGEKGPSSDRKENFDIALGGIEWLQKEATSFVDPTAAQFIADGIKVMALLKPEIVNFAEEVEHAFHIDGFTEEVRQSEAAYFVRFIHYFGDCVAGQETGEAHTDQSGFTFHLFEDSVGLQCYTIPSDRHASQWIDMPVSEGESVVIPAMQLQLRSKGQLKALVHRVIATEETASTGRYSAVCFIQLKNTPKYNKLKRLQDLHKIRLGFNYLMENADFSTFFR